MSSSHSRTSQVGSSTAYHAIPWTACCRLNPSLPKELVRHIRSRPPPPSMYQLGMHRESGEACTGPSSPTLHVPGKPPGACVVACLCCTLFLQKGSLAQKHALTAFHCAPLPSCAC
eukprot:1159592-Pelagomonas_calceolata.AAC.4